MGYVYQISAEKNASIGSMFKNLGAGYGRKLRSLSDVVNTVKKTAPLGGKSSEYARQLASKAESDLMGINSKLLKKDVNPFNVVGRISKKRQLNKANKLMTDLSKVEKDVKPPIPDIPEPPKKKKIFTKKRMLIGGTILGTAAVGDSILNRKTKSMDNNYGKYY